MRVGTRVILVVIFGRKVVEFPRLPQILRHSRPAVSYNADRSQSCAAVRNGLPRQATWELRPPLQTSNTTRTLVRRRPFVFSEIEVTLLASLAAAPLATPLDRT